MKQAASIYPLWWNPWGKKGISFDKKVSISIDNLSYDKTADIKILFLAEPLAVLPDVGKEAMKSAYVFDKIYTFCQEVLEKHPQAELFEWGATGLKHGKLQLSKSNKVSFITSSKSQTDGHRLRLEIFDFLQSFDSKNGLKYYAHKSPPFHPNKNDFFESYKFHICAENSIQANYFTEKIIDCFSSKTLPIYWGCPNLGDWFEMGGVITFSNLDELKHIVDRLNASCYDRRQNEIEANYETAKKYHTANGVVPRLTRKITEYVNS
ncbi:MAG: glycosyltransferase family 10 domain-containing protein [Gammaproteobacteria bacterium]